MYLKNKYLYSFVGFMVFSMGTFPGYSDLFASIGQDYSNLKFVRILLTAILLSFSFSALGVLLNVFFLISVVKLLSYMDKSSYSNKPLVSNSVYCDISTTKTFAYRCPESL
ncbi:hypothetical protein [Halobacteriovorax sp. DPLXC-1]|uniref:hypothetical protein n=1 Tax=Halobacteriovorax sp. DPLXC-1 TaxID=3110771 RepID=UPI002FF221D8